MILPIVLLRKCVQVLMSFQTIDANGRGGGGSRNMNYFLTQLYFIHVNNTWQRVKAVDLLFEI